MTNQEIVSKLWNLCNILRDDGITYHQYVTELTYILFKNGKGDKNGKHFAGKLPLGYTCFLQRHCIKEVLQGTADISR